MSKKQELECLALSQVNELQPSLGEQLRLAREQAGMSIDDVAKQLYLSKAVIEEIESDNIPASANTLFSKGYVKSYSALLRLPIDDMLKCFQLQYQCNIELKKMQTFSNRSKNATHNNYLNWITLIAIVVMTMGVIAWWWQQSEQVIIQIPAVETIVASNESSPRLPLTPNIATMSQSIQSTTVNSTFAFTQDCWVKITDATNAVVAVGIKKAGSSMDVSGVAPLEVVLGAAHGVKITYQQQVLDISSYISNNTAKFTLPLEQ
jgi:cytoskeleton protein RodZ